MVNGSEIGGFGGGWLEQPRQWQGAQWAGLFIGAPSCPEPPGAPRGGTRAEPGHCRSQHFDHAAAQPLDPHAVLQSERDVVGFRRDRVRSVGEALDKDDP